MRETGKGKGTDSPLGSPGRKMVQPTPFFFKPSEIHVRHQTSEIENCETTSVCCFEPLSLC